MKKLQLLKMSDGAELLVTVLDDTNTNVLLVEKARVVMFQRDENGRVGVAFPPWSMVIVDREIEINRDHIITYGATIDKQIEDTYLQQTSGIALG